MLTLIDLLIVAVAGGLLGACELITRYRDEPFKAVINSAAGAYVVINSLASVLALVVLNAFDVNFGIPPQEVVKLHLSLVLVAALGAMAFFRSSLFTFKVGGQDLALGPGLVLQVLLAVTDRQVDRSRASARATMIAQLMQGVDFEKARTALPAFCFGLMQNVTKEEQAAVGDQVTKLGSTGIPGPTKALLLGLLIVNVVGEAALKAAIDSLGADIVNS
ncbi:MAG TPA: hypothetical protein VF680_09830 [Allosphingosinicella sp.]|jgi:hypothetical protein